MMMINTLPYILIFFTVAVHSLPFSHDNAVYAAQQGKWQEAQEKLQTLLVDDPDNADILYDAGVTASKCDNFSQAFAYFTQAALIGKNDILKEQAYFNAGNAAVALKKLEEALVHYENALSLNQHNEYARHNRDVIKKMLEEQKQKEQQDKQHQQKRDQQNSKDDCSCNNQQQDDSKNGNKSNDNDTNDDEQTESNQQPTDQPNQQSQQQHNQQKRRQNKHNNTEDQSQEHDNQESSSDQSRQDKGKEKSTKSSNDTGGKNNRDNEEQCEQRDQEKQRNSSKNTNNQSHDKQEQREQQKSDKHDTGTSQQKNNSTTVPSHEEKVQEGYENQINDPWIVSLLDKQEDRDREANRQLMEAKMRYHGSKNEQNSW